MKILILGPQSRNQNIIDFLISLNNEVMPYEDVITVKFLKKNKIDFIISSGYAPIVKEPVILEYKNKIINLHNTYLPYGKGIFPIFWNFFENTQTGVTVHFIDAGIDSGDIIFQKKVDFNKKQTIKEAHDILLAELEKLFIDNWNNLITDNFERQLQEQMNVAVKYRSRIDSEKFIDLLPKKWDTNISEIAKLGEEFNESIKFWNTYDLEISSL